jgi:hypothetical protein
VVGTGRAASTEIAHDDARGCESAQVPTLLLQSPAQPNLGSDTNCQDQPLALLPINRTVGSFADHLRGDVRNACSHSSPAVALLNQNELARRTMNVVWVVLRSTSFCFFSLYMGKKRIHVGIAASTSESPATIIMFTHNSMLHYLDTTPRRPRSPRSERVVRLGINSPTPLFGGKEGNKNYKHLGTELLDREEVRLTCKILYWNFIYMLLILQGEPKTQTASSSWR